MDILKIHTKQWTPPPSESFLEELADKCVGMFVWNSTPHHTVVVVAIIMTFNKPEVQASADVALYVQLNGTRHVWMPQSTSVLSGYCGADIKAVCSEAALCALRRCYPQIYSSSQKLVLDVDSIAITSKDFMSAMLKMVPASQRFFFFFSFPLCELPSFPMPCPNIDLFLILRAVVSPAKALIPAIRPLLSAALQSILHVITKVFPHAERGLRKKTEEGSVLPLPFPFDIW